jgi:hypothetical protein
MIWIVINDSMISISKCEVPTSGEMYVERQKKKERKKDR